MKLFEALDRENRMETAGEYAPYYFRYLGYSRDYCGKPAVIRANGISALFTETKPVILQNEIIAGNQKALYSEADEISLSYAKRVTESFGSRNFCTNKDHYAPDYERILNKGIGGLVSDIDRSLKKFENDRERTETLRSMRMTLCAFSEMIGNYAKEAQCCKERAGYQTEYLDFIIGNCSVIAWERPQNFAQALQLLWFCHLAFLMEERYAMALGRMDQYLYPFYRKDVDSGVLTDNEVIGLLENVFIRLQDDVVNICVGGQNSRGESQANPLSLCILYAVRNCNVPGPNLSLRLAACTPDSFLDECLKVIGTGLGYPAIMNDDVNIAALKKCGYEEEDIYNYSMVGCIENFITGMQPPWSDGRFDTPRFIDYVLNNGKSSTSRSQGIDTGSVEQIHSMREFMEAFEKQIDYGVSEYMALFGNKNDAINQKHFPEPFLSCFCYDCIGRGLDINNGGSKYPSVHGVGLMGIGTVSDSLAAIEKVVFEEKNLTLAELKQILNEDFCGQEEIRQKLLDAPKYGNNNDYVDKYAVWFVDYLAECFGKYRTRDGGRIYICMSSNISNIYAGQETNATPDGRKRGEPLSDTASPTYGRDVRGATASLTSVAKPDYEKVACGSVVNQKYSPSMFSDAKRAKLLALIRTYFKKGGQELQINATSREILEDAMEHPEKYQNLVVRVSGFSAVYVTLRREVQLDILSRTQQE